MKCKEGHNFHIPVMGLGFTIDTPLKVSQFGISSVISLADDGLIERMREMYCNKFDLQYQHISRKAEDYRAKRITSYLNLINKVVKERFEELRNSILEKNDDLKIYMDLMPDFSLIKKKFRDLVENKNVHEARKWLHDNLKMGSIDVNIMTKLDKVNFRGKKRLPIEFNDAHAAVRGFANSTLESSMILSAGMNPRLYGYVERFHDFYLGEDGKFKKKIVLKVSDYRSALIQGKFLAKKGLWVSEFRVESGLNCGGHVFPSDGYLLGPILEEFKSNKSSLTQEIFELYVQVLKKRNLPTPHSHPEIKITAQGGVGTAGEHRFLLDHYDLDSVGWGTPFLLVPEVVNVDSGTLELLKDAKEKDLYLSHISPLGVRFNSIRGNSKDIEKQVRITKGKPGSPCPKKHLSLNYNISDKGICTASRKYQDIKIKELNRNDIDTIEYNKSFERIVNKTCLCVGLGTFALMVNDMDTKIEGKGVSICPGPNLSYFSEIVSLNEMVDHIYGRMNIIKRIDRPNLFVKELRLYMDYFIELIEEASLPLSVKQMKHLTLFRENINAGIDYYKNMVTQFITKVDDTWDGFLDDLEQLKIELGDIRFAFDQKNPGILLA